MNSFSSNNILNWFTGEEINVSETERHFLSSFSKVFETSPSSVSDYVPAAIADAKNTPMNARVF